MATVFVSPGVYHREEDFTAFASRIGITKLGVVGKFPKGPAFEAVKISTADENVLRFGGTNYEFPATYITDAFLTQSSELFVSRVLGKVGFTNSPAWLLVANFDSGTTGVKSGTTLAVIRSKKDAAGVPYFSASTDVVLGNSFNVTGSALSSFVLCGTTGLMSANTLTVSLDETRTDYLAKALGKSPKVIASTTNLYVESIYPHFVREASARGEIQGIHATLVYVPNTNVDYANYSTGYTHAVTPWIVSRVIGSAVKNLFRVHTRSDGDSSNREVKISISNIDLNNNLFDIVVRYYDSSDATSFTIVERWNRLSLDVDSSRFIARVIGTVGDEPYPRQSNFIEIEMADNFPIDTVPAGFRGYELRSTTSGGTTIRPNIYYKTTYFSGDSVPKTYLGVSELGYTALTASAVGVRNAAQNVEHDLFQFPGAITSGKTTTLGFHMENTVLATEFATGDKNSMTGYTNTAGALDRAKLKFTVVPYGGFDGWDKYKTYTNAYDEFAEGETSNVQAYKDAIDVFASEVTVDINLLATSGVDYQNNETVVKYALEMTEERADLFYVMDAPRGTAADGTDGTADAAVEALELTGIDTTYAATYWPWVQVADVNTSRYTYLPPTFAVVRAMAFTDNKYHPWNAPAGFLRGAVPSNVIRADVHLSRSQRDVLYSGRINPILDSTQNGVLIWGQKTMQVKESALDRINVRRLLLQIERLVAAAAITLVFEQNDQTLRDQFLAKVEPILLQIQNQRGITGFKVVMDASNNTPETIDRNMLIGKIQIKPTRVAEFVDLTFQILPTGANFEEF